ncbi:MAG TPA: flagellar export protein FliJ [Terriglobales bacterium]|nr:flagellar export protein FliJ [Terriglobales bacterium]
MAFRFPLDAVLHFRQSVEHQQELRLRAANQQVARVRHMIEQIEVRMRQMRLQESQQLGTGTTAAELRFAASCQDALREQRQATQRELHRLQSFRDEQQRIFHRARRERETFESLRDHQRREYEREAARLDQRRLDDFFLLRQSYLRRG